jgi:crotonobetainyl-CoA:carnitine CoA-transferase CaiB-like acyl-CoA transferase
MAESALEGLRVVEFTDEIGAYCGRLLADLGAEVTKIEPPGGGVLRHTPPYVAAAGAGPDSSLAFWVHNTSKRSVVLDLESAEDCGLARALALTADVVLEDFPPGYLAERGLGFEALRAEKPALVYTSVTGFGQDGPHAGYAFSDIVGQAMGGVMTLAGEMEDPPNLIYGNQAAVSASIQAAQGTLLAVLHAEATGRGQQVDVSAQEALSLSQETAMQTWDLQKTNRVRTGERGMLPVELPGIGVLPCRDGHVALMVLAPGGGEFPDLVDWMREEGAAEDLDEEPYAEACRALDMGTITQLMADPASAMELMAHFPHITEVVGRFFAGKTAAEAYEEGQGRNLLLGLVSTPRDLAENAQLRARDWYITLPAGEGGAEMEFPGPPYRLSETPPRIERPPPLGEHTEQVLAALR